MTKPILQLGGKEALPEEVFREDREDKKGVKRTRDCDIIPINPTYFPFGLQHLVLTQTHRLLEECCYNEMGNVTSFLNGGGLVSLASLAKIALLPEN